MTVPCSPKVTRGQDYHTGKQERERSAARAEQTLPDALLSHNKLDNFPVPFHIPGMVAVNSTMLPLGTPAPDFQLPDLDGKPFRFPIFKGGPLLVTFICNHCPFVKHLAGQLAQLGRDYQSAGAAIVAINANDVANYPDDSPARK